MECLNFDSGAPGGENFTFNQDNVSNIYSVGSLNASSQFGFESFFNGSEISHIVHVDPLFEEIKFYLNHVVSTILCLVGIAGNILNVIVLTRQRMKSSIDGSMEKAAYMGLIALAVSDFLFCLCTLPNGFFGHQQTMFEGKSFALYYAQGKHYIQNVFSHTSTWLTVIIAVSRYAAICHPLHAKIFVDVKGTRLAIIMVFVIWLLLELPHLWTYTVLELQCADGQNVMYLLDLGPFSQNKRFSMVFHYLWAFIGYFIPVCILIFCNTQLTHALRHRYSTKPDYRVHGRTRQHNSRITPTLICMIVMFVLLVSPSEIIQFTFYIKPKGDTVEYLLLLIAIFNVLHTMNFTINFVLYCILNSHFRKTLMNVFCFKKSRKPKRYALGTITYSNGASRIYAGANSTETVL